MTDHKDLVIVPDGFTLWAHNAGLLKFVMLLSIIGICWTMLVGAYSYALVSAVIFAMAAAIQPLLCGWVHNFAAYAIVTNDPKLDVKR